MGFPSIKIAVVAPYTPPRTISFIVLLKIFAKLRDRQAGTWRSLSFEYLLEWDSAVDALFTKAYNSPHVMKVKFSGTGESDA